MLTELYLKNYILIKELRLAFQEGMTVITGETGAGKSILVGALNLVFGGTSTQQIAFDSKQDVYLEITFKIPPKLKEVHAYLEEIGYPAEQGELIAAREFTVGGKTTSYLNGKKTSISTLKELHGLLIDFHHQRDQQNLLNPTRQLDLLDQFGGLMPLRKKFQQTFKDLRDTLQKRDELQAAEEANRQLVELYRFQLDELLTANLVPNEDAELEQEFQLLSHSEDILNLSDQVYQTLYEQENSLYDSLGQVLTQLQKYTEMSGNITEICSKLETCVENIQDVSAGLRSLKEQVTSDPERLNDVRQRLDLINTLKTKYKKPTLPELAAYREQIEHTILSQDSSNEELQRLSKQIDELFTSCAKQADKLTERRQETALRLAKDITNNIKQLSIPHAQLEIQIDKKTDEKILLTEIGKVFSESGQDTVEFRFSANPGSPVLPLKAIVSGGELSRILLATKQSLAREMPPRTIILDEIDVGIGGKTAGKLADFIHRLAAGFQVVCITHLAQIAAAADHHVTIEKKTKANRTVIEVETVDNLKRINEIARMLSGKISELSVRHARELLNYE
jgi:DNA repair protein RecN (Recombination protein N)